MTRQPIPSTSSKNLPEHLPDHLPKLFTTSTCPIPIYYYIPYYLPDYFITMPTSSGANKRARANEDNESNVAKKKAVFDPKDASENPKAGGKKMTAAQRRKSEAEAAKAPNPPQPTSDSSIEEEAQTQAETTPTSPIPGPSYQPTPGPSGMQNYQGHSAHPGVNPGPYVTPGKANTTAPSSRQASQVVQDHSPIQQHVPGAQHGFIHNGQVYQPGHIPVPLQHQQIPPPLPAPQPTIPQYVYSNYEDEVGDAVQPVPALEDRFHNLTQHLLLTQTKTRLTKTVQQVRRTKQSRTWPDCEKW